MDNYNYIHILCNNNKYIFYVTILIFSHIFNDKTQLCSNVIVYLSVTLDFSCDRKYISQ